MATRETIAATASRVAIGLVVSRCGMPLNYEVFAGNTADVTTLEEIVAVMKQRYGKSDRIGVMDHGMVSEENSQFLKESKRRHLVGTPKPMLWNFERELLKHGWREVRSGVEVKLCPSPDGIAAPRRPVTLGSQMGLLRSAPYCREAAFLAGGSVARTSSSDAAAATARTWTGRLCGVLKNDSPRWPLAVDNKNAIL